MTPSGDAETDFLTRALDPARTVVVDACAGSGKTWLLVARIVRLLLSGAKPAEILAITFTRKGAQEMRARLTDSLRTLATAPEMEAMEFLRQRGVAEPELPSALQRARNLFEECLAAQPGVTVDTFHGWFLQLLERAPFDAGGNAIPADFTLEDRTSFLLNEAWTLFGAALQQDANCALREAFESLAAEFGYHNLRLLMGRFLAKRAEWWAYTRDRSDPVAFALGELRATLAVTPGQDPVRELMDDQAFLAIARGLAEVDAGRAKTQARFAMEITAALALTEPLPRFQRLYASCHTQAEGPSLALEKFYKKSESSVRERYAAFRDRLREARHRQIEHHAYQLNERALPVAARLLQVFQDLKRARQIVDFTDIEWRAYCLLASSEDTAFMHAKLDARYRHVLLDEFQDTNPLQWQAMRAWLDGYGADAGRPTVFLVGDPKQSIYRFRRAEPRLLEVAADTLVRDYGAIRLSTNQTRRCAPAIVEVINAMFAGAADYPEFPEHVSLSGGVQGMVEVLALATGEAPETDASRQGLAWRNPLVEPLAEHRDQRREREAAELALRIRELVGKWSIPLAGNASRPARYSDIMILKRSRKHLPIYESALRAQGIPYLTSRQGGLLDTMEAADLSALIEVLIAPFDDLKLAHALRSPVFGCSDDDLAMLARTELADDGERAGSWWRRLECLVQAQPEHLLQARPDASAALRRAQRLLAAWRAAADTAPVHDLLDRIYHQGEVLSRYRAACPPAMAGQVSANLERFLELALELDSGRYPSLPKFVGELSRLRVAPDQEAPDEGMETNAEPAAEHGDETVDAVHIYTIHGAKGLEAPVVWLIDGNADEGSEANDVLIDWPPDLDAPRHFSLFTVATARGRRRDEFFSTQAMLAERERLNLIYVAATRAKRYLMVSGVEDLRGKQGDTAYARVASAVAAMAGLTAPGAAAYGEIVISHSTVSAYEPDMGNAWTAPPPPPFEGRGVRVADDPAARSGSLLHRLLEHLVPPLMPHSDQLAPRLRRMLALPDKEFLPLWERAQRIVRAPVLRRFFDPGQYLRAENELEVIADGELRRIDRVVEFENEVWILDYKSGETPDREAWREQLSLYRSLLKPLFAGKNLRSAVVLVDAGLEEYSA